MLGMPIPSIAFALLVRCRYWDGVRGPSDTMPSGNGLLSGRMVSQRSMWLSFMAWITSGQAGWMPLIFRSHK